MVLVKVLETDAFQTSERRSLKTVAMWVKVWKTGVIPELVWKTGTLCGSEFEKLVGCG